MGPTAATGMYPAAVNDPVPDSPGSATLKTGTDGELGWRDYTHSLVTL